jgi:hypothetical protein
MNVKKKFNAETILRIPKRPTLNSEKAINFSSPS